MAATATDIFDDVVTIVRQLVLSEDRRWAVLLAADANGELLRLVGAPLAAVAEPGRRVRVYGRRRTHARYGEQIQVHRAEPEPAPAQEVLAVYELLRRAPHVGDKRASLLIERFGDEVLARIDENPLRVFNRVGRLPFGQAAEAARWWRRQRG